MEHEEKILEYKDREAVRKKEAKDDKIVIIGMAVMTIFTIILWIIVFGRM
jgi:hypothetical protein